MEKSQNQSTQLGPNLLVRGMLIGSAATIIIIGLLFKQLFVVAWVNGSPITRAQYDSATNAIGAQDILDQLIVEKLIQQKAENQNVLADQSQVDAQIQTIRDNLQSQNTSLEEALALQGMSESDLRTQITTNQLLESLVDMPASLSATQLEEYATNNMPGVDIYDEENQEMVSNLTNAALSELQQESVTNYIQFLKDEASITTWL